MMLTNWSDPESFWLNVTNVVLGITTFVALFSVFGAVLIEFWGCIKRRAAAKIRPK
jgi:hypothetical protein